MAEEETSYRRNLTLHPKFNYLHNKLSFWYSEHAARLDLAVATALDSWLALKALVRSSRREMVVCQSDYPRFAHFQASGPIWTNLDRFGQNKGET